MEEQGKGNILPAGLPPGFLQQVRQLSIPVWARLLALLLGLATFLIGIGLLWLGAAASGSVNGTLMDTGTKVITTAFVPVLVLVYLVFSETGVKALKRKTSELLARTVPEALETSPCDGSSLFPSGTQMNGKLLCEHQSGNPTAQYKLMLSQGSQSATLRFSIDLNVSKVNIVLFLPLRGADSSPDPNLMNRFKGTMEGAVHEGYSFDGNIGSIQDNGQRYATVCARRRLPPDFLWDPGAKLYFAQDLRFFMYSVVTEAWDLFCDDPS